jgi:hypothetical protein
MVGGIRAHRWAEAHVLPPVIAIWTGGLLVVSLLHLDLFDFAAARVIIWFAAYISYPLTALWLAWRHRRDGAERLPGAAVPRWARGYLLVQGTAASVLGLALVMAPTHMVKVWPWPITRLLAQMYAAPLLSWGVASLMLSRRRTWPEIRLGVIAMLVFAVGVLVASVVHRQLFSADQLGDRLWFSGFTVATVGMVIVVVAAGLRGKRRASVA